MYGTIKKIGDVARSAVNGRYHVETSKDGNTAYVAKRKLFSAEDVPLTENDIVGSRRKYNARFERALLRACDEMEQKGNVSERWYFNVEPNVKREGSTDYVKTQDAVIDLLKGRTYKPASDPRKPIGTIRDRKHVTDLKHWKLSLLPAAVAAVLTTGLINGNPDVVQKSWPYIGAGLTAATGGLGITGAYYQHADENLDTLRDLRNAMRSKQILF